LSQKRPAKKREPSASITALDALDTMKTSHLWPTCSAKKREQREAIIARDAFGVIANKSDAERSWQKGE
jgi:hypothetical protein